MSFLDTIIEADQQLLIYLNNFGSEPYDKFWLTITKPGNWWPLFVFWLVMLIKDYKWKTGLLLFVFICVTAGLSDQLVNLIKYTTARPRPCWQEGVLEQIRILKCSKSFSFVSGHATTSTFATTFIYLLFRKKYKWTVMFYIYPLLFAYSRIYMGKHYPVDIVCGYTLGVIEAILYLKLAKLLFKKSIID